MPPKKNSVTQKSRPPPRAFPSGLVTNGAASIPTFVLKHVTHKNIDVPFLLPEKDFASKGFANIEQFSEIQLKALVEDLRENLEVAA